MSELSIKCSARCTLLPDVSSSELLSNFSQNTELLSNRGSEQDVAGSVAKSRFLRKLLHTVCALFFRGECFSHLVLVSKWGDAVRTPLCPRSVCADRDALWVTHQLPGEPVFPITEEHRCVCSVWKCSQRALQYFHPWPLALSLSPAWLLLVLMLLRILNALCTGGLCDLSLGGHSLFHLIIFYW